MGVNPATREEYTTAEVIKLMFAAKLDWLVNGRAMKHYLEYYRTYCLTSTSLERLLSAHTYLDTAVIQAQTPDTRELMIMIYKELPTSNFDHATVVRI